MPIFRNEPTVDIANLPLGRSQRAGASGGGSGADRCPPASCKKGDGKPRCQRGYSLIELLVVLAILALIIGIAAPRAISYLGGAKSRTAKIQIEQIKSALDLYRLDVGRYPTAAEGLTALIEAPAAVEGDWAGPYLDKAAGLTDPWGASYAYAFPGSHGTFDLYTLGADGAEGGTGENKDVTSW